MGKPTASDFDRIVTPTGKVSGSQDAYMHEILAELIMGHPIPGAELSWMKRGSAMEKQAVDFFEFTEGVKTEPIGFMTNDEETIGASPDRIIVGRKRLLEIKCPLPHTHVSYLLDGSVEKAYYPQAQGQLYVAGEEFTGTDICSFHPEMPAAIVRIDRDEKFLAILAEQLERFVERLATLRAQLDERGLIPKPPPEPREFLTDEDVEAIIASKFGKGKAA